MPIYEYRCSACHHELEALQKFSDAPLLTCPQCAKDALVKKVSAAGFQLKGTGWYQTDFRGGGKPAATKSETTACEPAPAAAKSEASPATDGAGAKTESAKPAATPTPSAA